MMSRLVLSLAFLTVVGACSTDMTAPGGAMPANGLLVSLAVPGRCLVGGCDPFSVQLNRLGLVTLTNTGNAKVFLPLCGSAPEIGQQQFVNGQWVSMAIGYACVAGPVSKVILPHDSLQLNMWFGTGTWRAVIGAAADTLLTTQALSASAPVILQ